MLKNRVIEQREDAEAHKVVVKLAVAVGIVAVFVWGEPSCLGEALFALVFGGVFIGGLIACPLMLLLFTVFRILYGATGGVPARFRSLNRRFANEYAKALEKGGSFACSGRAFWASSDYAVASDPMESLDYATASAPIGSQESNDVYLASKRGESRSRKNHSATSPSAPTYSELPEAPLWTPYYSEQEFASFRLQAEQSSTFVALFIERFYRTFGDEVALMRGVNHRGALNGSQVMLAIADDGCHGELAVVAVTVETTTRSTKVALRWSCWPRSIWAGEGGKFSEILWNKVWVRRDQKTIDRELTKKIRYFKPLGWRPTASLERGEVSLLEPMFNEETEYRAQGLAKKLTELATELATELESNLTSDYGY